MPAARTADISIDVVIPVLNEAHVLAHSVARISRYLEANLPYRWQVVVVDNGSTDGTHEIARSLEESNGRVRLLRLNEPGRGRALRLAWLQSDADAVCYMDVDLSTDLDELPRLGPSLKRATTSPSALASRPGRACGAASSEK